MARFLKKDGTVIERDDNFQIDSITKQNLPQPDELANKVAGQTPTTSSPLNQVVNQSNTIKNLTKTYEPSANTSLLGIPGQYGSQKPSETQLPSVDNGANLNSGTDMWSQYKQSTLERLGLQDENEFKNSTGISLDTFENEFLNLYDSGQNNEFLDNFIGEVFRSNRDANLAYNNLNAQENVMKGNFGNIDQVQEKQKLIQDAINGGITTVDGIVNATGIDKNTVMDLMMGRYDTVELSDEEIARIKDESGYDMAMRRNQEDYDFKTEEANRRYQQIEEDFNESIVRQQRTNDIIEHNINKLAGITGAGFSTSGAKGIQVAFEQSKEVINDLKKNYSRATQQVRSYLQQLETDYVRNNQDLQQSLEDSIKNTTQVYMASIDSIKAKYSEASDEAVRRLNDATAIYQENIASEQQRVYDNMLQNNNLMRSNIQLAMQFQDYQTTEMQRMANTIINTGGSLAEVQEMVTSGQITPQLGQEIKGQIVANSVATIDAMTGFSGIGNSFQEQIIQGLESGKSASEVIREVLQSPEMDEIRKNIDPLGYQQQKQSEVNNQLKQLELLENIADMGGWDAVGMYSQTLRGKTDLQCGELVNDYWTQMTGSRAGVGNSYESKVQAIQNAGQSMTPQIGGMFAYDIGEYGHVGIVTQVFDDGSIEVYEANSGGSEYGSPPEYNTYTPQEVEAMVFSEAPDTAGMTSETPRGLSPNAKSVWEGNRRLSDYNKSDQVEINKELEENGFYDRYGSGNGKYQELDTTDDLAAFMALGDDLKELQGLNPEVNTGWFAGRRQKLAAQTTGASNEFVDFNSISGKYTSKYLKEISGAAVSEQEYERVTQYMPTVTNSDQVNEQNVDIALIEWEKLAKAKAKNYGFEDIEEMRFALGVGDSASAPSRTTTGGSEADEALNAISNGPKGSW